MKYYESVDLSIMFLLGLIMGLALLIVVHKPQSTTERDIMKGCEMIGRGGDLWYEWVHLRPER